MEDREVFPSANAAAICLPASPRVVGSFQTVPAEVDALVVQELDSFLTSLELLGELVAVSYLVPRLFADQALSFFSRPVG